MVEKEDKKAKIIKLLREVQPKNGEQERIKKKASPVQKIIGNNNIQAGGDVYINKKETIRNEVKSGPEHITEDQAFTLSELVKEAVERESKGAEDKSKYFASWWNKLKKRYKVASYRMIPREQGDEAINWMKQQVAMLLPKLRRTNNDKWRKSLYAKIHACLKTLGWEKSQFYLYVEERVGKKITSTTQLGERDLENIAGILSRMTER